MFKTIIQIIFNGTVVTKVDEQKHLGLILESKIKKAKKVILV